MGCSLTRYILRPNQDITTIQALAREFRHSLSRPSRLVFRNLSESKVRRSELKLFRDAGASIVDLVTSATQEQLIQLAKRILGEDGFLLCITNDEECDFIYPSQEWLDTHYPTHGLEWLLLPDKVPIPWNNTAMYAFPSNSPSWDETVPIMGSLLSVAVVGRPRPCPYCATIYTSRGERGQCPACGAIAQPFSSSNAAHAIIVIPIDAFGWGTCYRCRASYEFNALIEQCSRCGQMLQAETKRHGNVLRDNSNRIRELLAQLK
ncbi:MAG: hypothetical protein K8U03_16320 [Planctomycetia bacterium]|nr:hypothetical protein [Planctomycetia bacterium]